MGARRRRTFRIAAVGLAGLAGVGTAAVAALPAGATASEPSLVQIGPIDVGHGFQLILNEASCGTKHSQLLLEFAEGNDNFALTHSYIGPNGSCTFSSSLATGKIVAHWGRLLDVDMTFASAGGLKKTTLEGSSCDGVVSLARRTVAEGTFDVALDPRAFGTKRDRRVTSTLMALSDATCGGSLLHTPTTGGGFGASLRAHALARAALDAALRRAGATPATATVPTTTSTPASTTTTATTTTATTTTPTTTVAADGSGAELSAQFGPKGLEELDADTQAPYAPIVTLSEDGETPARGIDGLLTVVTYAHGDYVDAAGFDSGSVTAKGPYSTGELAFTAVPPVCNAGTLNGHLTGTLTVFDPVLGHVKFIGSEAQWAAEGNQDALLGPCGADADGLSSR